MAAHAKQHGMLAVMANYASPTGGLPSAGASAIWDETGNLVARAPRKGNASSWLKKQPTAGPEQWPPISIRPMSVWQTTATRRIVDIHASHRFICCAALNTMAASSPRHLFLLGENDMRSPLPLTARAVRPLGWASLVVAVTAFTLAIRVAAAD